MLNATPAPLQQLLRERKRSHTLPAAFYRDPDIFATDMEGIFKKHWIYVGVEPDVAEPGDVITVEVAGTSILIDYEFSARYRCPGAT
jgi:Rieske 2Fe-2S family protein